ncbi:MAG: gamma-glutamyltransferase [Gemmatimonadota bacterium]
MKDYGAAIATSSKLAADAGATMIEAGGNAADAAVAAALVSGVTEPGVVDLGSGAYATIWPAEGMPVTLDGGVEMPGRGLDEDQFGRGLREAVMEYAGGVRTLVGHGSVGTPGTLATLASTARRFGRLPWADLVEPAYQHARNGFALSYASHTYMQYCHEVIFGWDPRSRAALHRPDGSLLAPGETVHVAGLSESLRRIADHGAEDFYTGEIGQRIADEIAANEGILTERDLAEFEVIDREPLIVEMDGWQVATNPPPAVGGAVLAAMLLLLGDRPTGPWTAESLGLLARAQQAAIGFRAGTLDVTLDPEWEVRRLLEEAVPGPLRSFVTSPSTAHTSVVDSDGLAVSVTLSSGYGSGLLPPGTGIWMNNCLGELELNRRGIHAWPVGRRLPSNMAPTIARRTDGAVLAVGSPGADRITTAILQTLVGHVRIGLPLAEAIEHPRLHVSLDAAVPTMFYEAGLPVEKIDMPKRQMPAGSMMFGGVGAARWSPRTGFEVAADGRRAGGTAIAHRA